MGASYTGEYVLSAGALVADAASAGGGISGQPYAANPSADVPEVFAK